MVVNILPISGGYGWRSEEHVCNPFDVLLLFDTREFKAHWFETGTPTFLIDTLLRRSVASPELDGMSGTEALLASLFHSCFAAQGFDLVAEESSARARADMALRYDGRVYLFEFKTVGEAPEGAAPAQLGARGCADKYRRLGEPIHLVGAEFSRKERNVAAFAVERA